MSQNPEFLDLVPLIPAGTDVELLVEYYETQLGFQLLWRDGDPTEMAALKRGAVEILLYANEDESVAQQTSLRIRVSRVDLLHTELRCNGVKLADKGTIKSSPWGTKEFSVIDPSGVCLTFYEPEK